MKSYKFSELIEEITEYNTELKYGLNDIVGVTIEKALIPTIANLTQTSLEKFYIVKPNTFVYNPRTHGVRLGMGYNQTERTYITTWNNFAFKVKDTMLDVLNPDYLWMYFNRSEWDRETNFKAWGSSTIVFSWNIFMNMSIKLPEKSIQDTLVKQYTIIKNRIELKKKINDNLANVEQSILVETIINNQTVPTVLGELVDFIDGDRGKNYPTFDEFTPTGYCLFLNASNVTSTGFNFDSCMFVTEEKDKLMNKGHLAPYDIVLTSRGTLGNVALYDKHVKFENVRINSGMLIIRSKNQRLSPYFIYVLLKSSYMKAAIEQFKSGSAQPQLPIKDLQKITFEIPESDDVLSALDRRILSIEEQISINKQEMDSLKDLCRILLAKLSR